MLYFLALFDVKKPAVEDRALVKAVNVVKIVRDNVHHPLLREFDVSMVYANSRRLWGVDVTTVE